MIGLLDLGNSRFKYALLDDGGMGDVYEAAYDHQWRDLVQAIESMGIPGRLLVASVLSEPVERDLMQVLGDRLMIQPVLVRSRQGCRGLQLGYDVPERLGVDRFLGILAARERYKAPFLLVSGGTAVTIDAVDAEGSHLGGLILPGLGTLRACLVERAAALSGIGSGVADKLFASNPEDAVASGMMRTLVASIDRNVHEMSVSLGGGAELIITGGDADELEPRLERRYHVEPNLVIRGLALLA